MKNKRKTAEKNIKKYVDKTEKKHDSENVVRFEKCMVEEKNRKFKKKKLSDVLECRAKRC